MEQQGGAGIDGQWRRYLPVAGRVIEGLVIFAAIYVGFVTGRREAWVVLPLVRAGRVAVRTWSQRDRAVLR